MEKIEILELPYTEGLYAINPAGGTVNRKFMTRFIEYAGRPFVIMIEEFGRIMLLLFDAISWMMRPPFRFRIVFKQMEFVGAGINFSDEDIKALLTSIPLPK